MRGSLALIPILAVASACAPAEDAPPAWEGSVDTLASGVVVVRNPQAGAWAEGRGWTLEQDLRIGSLDSEGPDQFAYVPDVWADALGRIWVIDGPSVEIRVFDPEGRFVRAFGRKGRGPGELLTPIAMEEGPDGYVWVPDGQNRRFTVFDTAGTFVESHTYAQGIYGFGDRWGADGLLYTNVARRGPVFVLDIVRRRLGSEGLVPVDTLPVPEVDSGEIVPVSFARDGRRFTAMVPIPFQPTAVRLLTAGSGWWLSHPGPTMRLARLGPRGDTVRVIERAWEPVPVTSEDIDAAVSAVAREVDFPREGIPDVHPPVRELAELPDGHLLVRRMGEGGEVFDVYDPQGVYLGSVPVPGGAAFTLHTATDEALYGVTKDSLDVPYVVRLRIGRGRP